jgi:tetratricopeptide (TPR) repeat protein
MGPGDVLADRFEIERVAAAGGMGRVYEAADRRGGRVAVKVLLEHVPEHAERFVREAAILEGLDAPAIVKYVAHGRTSENVPYLVVEWVQGESLKARLDRGRLDLAESALLVRRIASGLAVAHARGIVHRDLKPSNILLPDGDLGRAVVVDFGIARASEHGLELTKTGHIVGTIRYMAPEQARGQRVDARADIYALGALWFRCLSGRMPFEGEDLTAILAQLLFEQAPRLSEAIGEVPAEIDDLVAAMLSVDPAMRPADGAELARQLETVTGDRISAAPFSRLTRAELQFASFILAVPGGARPDTSTQVSLVGSANADALRAIVAPFAADVAGLRDGTIIAKLSRGRSGPDHATSAARCALAIREAHPELGIALASGMSTDRPGPMIAERAARSLGRASPGRIHIDDVTARLVEARFEVEPRNGALVLSRERPLLVPRTLLGKPTPCIGRERELDFLESIFAECAAERSARVVVVTAAPGIGKSRLSQELAARLTKGWSPTIWAARADPMGAGAPFGLIGQALRRAAESSSWDAWIARRVGTADAERVATFLGEISGMPRAEPGPQLAAARADPRLMGDQIVRAWEDLVRAECAVAPVLVAFDDVQWGDLPSLGLVDGTLQRLSDAPLMVLALGRPELDEIFPRLFVDRGAQILQLNALTKGASEKLVRAAVTNAEPSAIARAVELSGGNAFYLEELARTVSEGPIERIPETILAMGEARLRGLDPEMRRVLRAASVFGDVFWTDGIARLMGRDGLDELLDTLAKGELVTVRTHSRFGGTREFAFRHALLREASYATLTDEDRATGHRLAAAWLEGAGERSPLVLARHFELAGLLDRAAPHFVRAAQGALGGNDFAAVEAMVASAIRGGLAGNGLADAHLLLAEAHLWRGENPRAIDAALAAMAAADRPSATWCIAASEAVALAARTLDRALQADLLEQLANEPIPKELQGPYVFACARALMSDSTGIDATSRLMRRVEAMAQDAKLDARTMGRLLVMRGVRGGSLETRVRDVEAAHDCFVEAGDHRYATLAQMNLGGFYADLGAYDRAEAALRRALALASKMGLGQVTTWGTSTLAAVFHACGKTAEAETVVRSALAGLEKQHSRRYESTTRTLLARLLAERGDLDGAETEARAALECGAGAASEATAAAALSSVFLLRDRTADAVVWARHAMSALEQYERFDAFDDALVELALVRALLATDATNEANEVLARAHAALLERASKLESASYRASFLERIPEHAALVALASSRAR